MSGLSGTEEKAATEDGFSAFMQPAANIACLLCVGLETGFYILQQMIVAWQKYGLFGVIFLRGFGPIDLIIVPIKSTLAGLVGVLPTLLVAALAWFVGARGTTARKVVGLAAGISVLVTFAMHCLYISTRVLGQ